MRIEYSKEDLRFVPADLEISQNRSQPNARNSHVVADEITCEQYILKKCPCRPVERRFSETQCSQVGVFAVTWEQYVPDNRPYRPLQGRFSKTYRSQVFLSAADLRFMRVLRRRLLPLPRPPPHNFLHRRRFDGGIRREHREKLLEEYIRRHY